jgi:hypothetical protein
VRDLLRPGEVVVLDNLDNLGSHKGQAVRAAIRFEGERCLRIGNESRFEIENFELSVPRNAVQSQDVRYAMATMQVHF